MCHVYLALMPGIKISSVSIVHVDVLKLLARLALSFDTF
jgi:hypothetical protein